MMSHLKAFSCAIVFVTFFSMAASADDHGRTALLIEAAVEEKALTPEVLKVVDNLITNEAFLAPSNRRDGFDSLFKTPSELPDKFPFLVGQTLSDVGLERAQWERVLHTPLPPSNESKNCPTGLNALVDWYVDELTPIARGLGDVLQRCQGVGGGCDMALELTDESQLRTAFDTLDQAGVGPAIRSISGAFLTVHQHLTTCLRDMAKSHQVDVTPNRRATPLGDVVIGSLGADVHAMDNTFLVIDPGGDDRYVLASPKRGSVQSIMDLRGDDTYQGSNIAVLGASVILDMAGHDRYESRRSGQAASLGGMSLLVDVAGDDVYQAGEFAQGAAAFGVGVLIDGHGRDRFELTAMGQGFGATQGTGVLWDLEGSDTYKAVGLPGEEVSVGGQSWAQGVGRGLRTGHGGGIGLLLDNGGNDQYVAEKFAQGSGYYYGVGLLHDTQGDDHYQAQRYAQGTGAHMALGMLRDETGNDTYSATIGVSQGMGLDTAVGVLHDVAGDDAYVAGTLAQGYSTANGVGIALDLDGTDHFDIGSKGWGQGHVLRRLPGTAFLIGADTSDRFVLGGREASFSSLPRSGPHGLTAPYSDKSSRHDCPSEGPSVRLGKVLSRETIVQLLGASAPRYGAGEEAVEAYRTLTSDLPQALGTYISAVPERAFALNFSMREVVRCWLGQADEDEREEVRRVLTNTLSETVSSSRPWLAGTLLSEIKGGIERHKIAIEALLRHPACSARSTGLDLVGHVLQPPAKLPVWLKQIVDDARTDPCWRVQAAISALDQKYSNGTSHCPGLPEFRRHDM